MQISEEKTVFSVLKCKISTFFLVLQGCENCVFPACFHEFELTSVDLCKRLTYYRPYVTLSLHPQATQNLFAVAVSWGTF